MPPSSVLIAACVPVLGKRGCGGSSAGETRVLIPARSGAFADRPALTAVSRLSGLHLSSGTETVELVFGSWNSATPSYVPALPSCVPRNSTPWAFAADLYVLPW